MLIVESSKQQKPETYQYIDVDPDTTKIILEQLCVNAETYTELQAQEALDLARAARDIVDAEDKYTLGRFSEGIIQLRALENKVVEVKNRLRIANLQLAFVERRLATQGFEVGDADTPDFAQRLQTKPVVHAPPLTSTEVGMITSFARSSQGSRAMTTTDLLFQEPVSRLNISQWARATVPGEVSEMETTEAELLKLQPNGIDKTRVIAVATGETLPDNM